MTGKAFCANLKYYLDPLMDCGIYLMDTNRTPEQVPYLLIGITSEQQHEHLLGNYVLEAFIMVKTEGYEDDNRDNEEADTIAAQVIDALNNTDCFKTINAPISGDSRPYKNFSIDGMFITGMERQDDESSTTIFIELEAYTANT